MRDIREDGGLRGCLRSVQGSGDSEDCRDPAPGAEETHRDFIELEQSVRVCQLIHDQYERGMSLKEAVAEAEKAREAREKEK